MKKNDNWINALFALVFIAAPALLLYFFLLPSWTGKELVSYGAIWGIAIGFITYVVLFSILLIKFDWLTIESLNFNLPVSISLMAIFVTYPLPLWAVALITIATILLAFPINIYVRKYKEYKISKNNEKNKN